MLQGEEQSHSDDAAGNHVSLGLTRTISGGTLSSDAACRLRGHSLHGGQSENPLAFDSDGGMGVPDRGDGSPRAMRMLRVPRAHMDSSRFRLRWSCMLLAPLLVLALWLGSMFAVNVQAALRADRSGTRLQLSNLILGNVLQLHILVLERGATPAVPANASYLHLSDALAFRIGADSRRLLHGTAAPAMPLTRSS